VPGVPHRAGAAAVAYRPFAASSASGGHGDQRGARPRPDSRWHRTRDAAPEGGRVADRRPFPPHRDPRPGSPVGRADAVHPHRRGHQGGRRAWRCWCCRRTSPR